MIYGVIALVISDLFYIGSLAYFADFKRCEPSIVVASVIIFMLKLILLGVLIATAIR